MSSSLARLLARTLGSIFRSRTFHDEADPRTATATNTKTIGDPISRHPHSVCKQRQQSRDGTTTPRVVGESTRAGVYAERVSTIRSWRVDNLCTGGVSRLRRRFVGRRRNRRPRPSPPRREPLLGGHARTADRAPLSEGRPARWKTCRTASTSSSPVSEERKKRKHSFRILGPQKRVARVTGTPLCLDTARARLVNVSSLTVCLAPSTPPHPIPGICESFPCFVGGDNAQLHAGSPS